MKENEAMRVQEAQVLAPQAMSIEGVLMRAVESGVSIETMEKLLVMRRELRAEAAQEAFYVALSQFQADCPVIKKTKGVKDKGGAIRYRYAPLEVIMATASPIMKAHGLSITMKATVQLEDSEALLNVSCEVHHIAGHTETSDFKLPIDKDAYMNPAQRFGSASTYAKRYAFCNALGILTGDDDNDGGKLTPAEAREAVKQPQAKKATPKSERPKIHPAAEGDGIEANTIKVLSSKMDKATLSTADFEKRFGFAGLENVKKSDINAVMGWIADPMES